MDPVRGMHGSGCGGGDCPGCWTGENAGAAPAPAELKAVRVVLEESNRGRLAAIAGQGLRIPDFTVGMLELLADHTLGVGTVARETFTLAWEREIEKWLEATEAEIAKAKLMAAAPEATQRAVTSPRRSALTVVGNDPLQTTVVPDL